jgi:hypothetical protein
MKLVYTGLESSGKSLMLSRKAGQVLKRNARWHKYLSKIGKPHPRTMAFNQPMSVDFRAQIELAGLKYVEYQSFHEMEYLTDTDFFIDELLKIFPAYGTEPLPPHVMDFLTQAAKNGNHIYASTQDFSQVHKQFRLLTNRVIIVKKIYGSPRPMLSRPPVKSVYGVALRFFVKPESFKGDNATMEHKFIPLPFLIRKKDTERYNTLYRVPRTMLPDRKLRPQRIFKVLPDGKEVFDKIIYK